MAEKNGNLLRNIVGVRRVYDGHVLNLRVDSVLFPSGSVKPREVIEHRPAVGIIAVDSEGCIILVSQYRHAVDEEILEIPAGIVEPGENNLDAAVRELQEEIGYRPASIRKLMSVYSSPGFTNEIITLFYATELTKSKLPEDDDEFINVVKVPLKEAEKMMLDGRIKDGKTVTACCWCMAEKAKLNGRN